jgi:LemA protein
LSLHTVVGTVVAGILLLGVGVYAVLIYNGLVRLRRNIDKAWSNIDVLRKQRADELPKLVDTVQQYVEHERGLLEDLTQARTRAEQASGPDEAADADSQLQGALGRMFAVAEDYPELKADDNFQQLQDRISGLEEQIADRREFYNESVNTYNIRINQIPYNIVAGLMNYQARDLFEADESELQDVDVGDAFGS